LVELLWPSVLFGLLYVYFGLLTAIIFHVVYDVFWFALPIFLATAPGIWLDKIIIIVVSLLPVWIVLRARMQTARWTELADRFYNRAWLPSEIEPAKLKQIIFQIHPRDIKRIVISIVLGCLGLLCWVVTTRFSQDNLPLLQSKNSAMAHAKAFLQEKN